MKCRAGALGTQSTCRRPPLSQGSAFKACSQRCVAASASSKQVRDSSARERSGPPVPAAAAAAAIATCRPVRSRSRSAVEAGGARSARRCTSSPRHQRRTASSGGGADSHRGLKSVSPGAPQPCDGHNTRSAATQGGRRIAALQRADQGSAGTRTVTQAGTKRGGRPPSGSCTTSEHSVCRRRSRPTPASSAAPVAGRRLARVVLPVCCSAVKASNRLIGCAATAARSDAARATPPERASSSAACAPAAPKAAAKENSDCGCGCGCALLAVARARASSRGDSSGRPSRLVMVGGPSASASTPEARRRAAQSRPTVSSSQHPWQSASSRQQCACTPGGSGWPQADVQAWQGVGERNP